MIHERKTIKAENSQTGLVTIAGLKVTDDGVERQEWMGKVRKWEEIQYAAELMPNLLNDLIAPSPMTTTFFGDM